MAYQKIHVEVTVRFWADGGMRPLEIAFDNGQKFTISKVKFIERAPARVSSIAPVRYTVMIGNKQRYLYFEKDVERWFVEKEIESYFTQRP